MPYRIIYVVISALAIFLAFPAITQSQQAAHRLILKDGSYQSVTEYAVKGDRVRYYSAEREEWEELPSSLVDWPATEKYEKDRAAAPAIPEAPALDKDKDLNDDREGDDSSPEVAPGLHLPGLPGMYLLDNFKGQPQLAELQQDEGDINNNRKTNILRGALGPIASTKQTVELDGEHASLYAHVAVPSIYIKLEDDASTAPPPGETASAKPSQPSLDAPRATPQQPEQPQQPQQATVPFGRFRIVRLKVKNGKRIVGDFKRAASGKVSQEDTTVKTTIDRVGSGWLKLTPAEALTPGEYAIIETEGVGGMNLYVWAFSANPNAPANSNPWTPDVKDKSQTKAASPKE